MFEHRFREFLNQPRPAASVAAANMAFVACPAFGFPAQSGFVAEVYRLAREMTEAQLRKPARSRIPAFSLN